MGCANVGLKDIADDYEHMYGKDAADFIRDCFYVDDPCLCLFNPVFLPFSAVSIADLIVGCRGMTWRDSGRLKSFRIRAITCSGSVSSK